MMEVAGQILSIQHNWKIKEENRRMKLRIKELEAAMDVQRKEIDRLQEKIKADMYKLIGAKSSATYQKKRYRNGKLRPLRKPKETQWSSSPDQPGESEAQS